MRNQNVTSVSGRRRQGNYPEDQSEKSELAKNKKTVRDYMQPFSAVS